VATQDTAKRPFWYLDGGDAVRALACLGIVCFHVGTGALYASGNLEGSGGHFTWATGYGEAGHILLRSASTGFYMFFVLSGFLVSAPFVAAFVEGRPRPRLVPFLRNRAARLLPAAWLLFAFVLLRHGANGASPGEIVAMFTFTDDQVDHPLTTLVGQTWTLRVDMAFYLLVPLAAAIGVRLAGTRLGMTGRRRAVWAGTIAAAAVPLTVAALVPETTGTTRSPATLLFLFMPGVAMAAALAGRRPASLTRWAAPAGTALSIAGVAVLMAFPRDQLILPYKLVVVGAGAAMALGGLILLERRAGRPWRWMQSRVVRWVGRRTYGIYLWHLALMAELIVLFGDSAHPAHTYAMLLPLVLLATLVAAELSFRFVERPAMRRLRDRAGRASVAAAHAPPAAPHAAVTAAQPAPAHAAAAKARRRHVATATPLRGLAVLAVVAFHVTAGALWVTGYLDGAGGTLQPKTAFGPVIGMVLDALPTAVYLFFALSGFLIARPFVEAFVSGAELPSLRSYARNRVLRIFPAAWLFIALLLFKYGDRGADTGQLLSMITLTESYTPHPLESLAAQLWSLKVELSFYLLVPIVAAVLWRLRDRVPKERRKRLVYALAATGAGVSLVYSAAMGFGDVQQRTLVWTLIAFASGVALAAFLVGAERRPAGRRIRVLAVAAFAAGLALALVSAHYGRAPWVVNGLAALSVTGLLWGPVVLEVRTGHTWRCLDNHLLAWVGDRSYAIYLFHLVVMAQLYPLVSGIEGYKVAYAVLLPLVVIASAAAAEVSWRLVERPALRLKRRSFDPAPPAVTAAGLLAPNPWQMTLGERAAMEGLLARLKPALAIEIGTAEGGSTRCLARHCTEIHSFDLVHPPGLTEELPMVTTHTGDSHALLPAFLEQLAAAGRRVDFVLVDGDHSADGARRDVEDLLASPAVEGAAMVLHDTANDEVRAGLIAAGIHEHPSVAYLDLDFVAGHLSAPGQPFEGQLWGGLGLVIADPAARAGGCVQPDLFEPAGELLRVAREVRELPYPAAAA
jgi:peptidoglycan/LPS O-acetylase OafA/YrhL